MASSNQKRMDALLFILKDELDQQWREDQAIIKQRQEEKRRLENPEPVPVQNPKWENTRKRTISPATSTDHKVVLNNKRKSEEELKFGLNGDYQSSGSSNGFTPGKTLIRVLTGKGKSVMEPEVREGGDDYHSRSSVPRQHKAPMKMKKTKRVIRAQNPEPDWDMPAKLRDHITKKKGGHDIKLVIQKFMHSSDLVRNNNRFSIPMAQIREPFLTEEEEHYFKQKSNGKKKLERDVTVIEPTLCETVLTFKRWDMEKKDGGKTSSSYVLIRAWMKVVERNRFRKDDLVQLWSFRVGSELNFALVVVRRAKDRDAATCSEEV